MNHKQRFVTSRWHAAGGCIEKQLGHVLAAPPSNQREVDCHTCGKTEVCDCPATWPVLDTPRCTRTDDRSVVTGLTGIHTGCPIGWGMTIRVLLFSSFCLDTKQPKVKKFVRKFGTNSQPWMPLTATCSFSLCENALPLASPLFLNKLRFRAIAR